MHSVFLDVGTLNRGDLDLSPLQNRLPGLQTYPYSSAAQLEARLKDADIVLLNKVPLNAETLAHAPASALCLAGGSRHRPARWPARGRCWLSQCARVVQDIRRRRCLR